MKTKLQNEWYWHAFLLIAVFLMLWPIVFMLSTSLKDLNQVFESTLNPLPFPPTFDNYTTVLHNFPLLTYLEYVLHCYRGYGQQGCNKRVGSLCLCVLQLQIQGNCFQRYAADVLHPYYSFDYAKLSDDV